MKIAFQKVLVLKVLPPFGDWDVKHFFYSVIPWHDHGIFHGLTAQDPGFRRDDGNPYPSFSFLAMTNTPNNASRET